MKNKIRNQEGYIALTSVIMVSLLLVTVMAAVCLVNYNSRFNVLETELKKRSYVLAEDCIDYSVSLIASDENYQGGECVFMGSGKCKIVSVSFGAFPKTIKAQSIYQKSYTNIQAVVDGNYHISSWQELPILTTSNCH